MNLRLVRVSALAAAAAALVATAVSTALPDLPADVDYTRGFCPPWMTVTAALLAMVAVALAVREHRGALVAGWVAAVLLLWSAGGVVLDVFRAFFWITGIPAGTFSQVDWPGMLTRSISLMAAALIVALMLPGTQVPGRPWFGYAAFALAFPYPLAKIYWWLGGTVGRPEIYQEGFPIGELIMLAVGAAGSLALARSWGRRLPRRIILAGGWTATATLTTMGIMSVFGALSQALRLTDGPVRFDDAGNVLTVGFVYGSWLLYGLALGAATLVYQRATRLER
ncbi:hypothetical protein GCM10023194_47860 [Planotetraspora phitsanulokensis]|uniref:Uncharacterized protein n=1 Tax=Planotetraspora phitsanulokensis TaxID=575192 RepID=A0A8J3XBY5_9ACTN|nr:hypothetical protein [Planotetraspora phitsanulokensis]GII35557.1 hypothetical protein Pph01_05600 [Planotetraspora phitsanulokensis]